MKFTIENSGLRKLKNSTLSNMQTIHRHHYTIYHKFHIITIICLYFTIL